MKGILLSLILIMSIKAMPQSATYSISTDTTKEENKYSLIFNGSISFSDLDKESTFMWLKNGGEYKPQEKETRYLRENLKNYSMVVFMGTWCDDSHELIPKLEKLLQIINYPQSHITMYGVDREKKTKNGENKTYNITLVPTIILFRDSQEIGRITESVQKSIEADLAAIIEKDPGEPLPR
jgi:thiol-disulfide isomerase/thioredoxin